MFISKNKAISLLLIFMGISSLHFEVSGARWLSENSEKVEENLVNAQVQMNSSNSSGNEGFFSASNREVPSSSDPLHNRDAPVHHGSAHQNRVVVGFGERTELDIMQFKFQGATLKFISKLARLHETVKHKVGSNATLSTYGDAFVTEATKLGDEFSESIESIRDEMCSNSDTRYTA